MSTTTLESKIIPFDNLKTLSQRLHHEKKRIITTNGCFDLVHLGHIKYLHAARQMGDVLVCGVNSDESVKKLKGPARPIQAEAVRALQLAGLESVDYVTIFHQDTPIELIRQMKPHIHVKGGDYKPDDLSEYDAVKKAGGNVVCIPFIAGFSTTELISKLRATSSSG